MPDSDREDQSGHLERRRTGSQWRDAVVTSSDMESADYNILLHETIVIRFRLAIKCFHYNVEVLTVTEFV